MARSFRVPVDVPVLSSDPSSLTDGEIWANSTDGVFKGRMGGSTHKFPFNPLNEDFDVNGNSINNVGILQFNDATELTISSGAITITQSYHTVDTESDASTDDLDTINGGTGGDVLFLRAANASRTVTLRHGNGNIVLHDQGDYDLNDTDKVIQLIYDGTNWHVVNTTTFVSLAKGWLSGSSQSISFGTRTKVQLNAEQFDTLDEFDTSTNYEFVALEGGLYLYIAQIRYEDTSSGDRVNCEVSHNDSVIHNFQAFANSTFAFVPASGILEMTAGDTLHMNANTNSSGGATVRAAGNETTFLIVKRIG